MPSPGGLEFGPFRLDVAAKRLLRSGVVIPLPARHVVLLHTLVSRAGSVVTKDELIRIAWQDVIATDNSLAQAITKIRKALAHGETERYIATEPGQGYRFVETVTRVEARGNDADIDALLAPHVAAMDGRAALETLQVDRAARARFTYEQLLARRDDDPRSHVGLASACLEQFEATRADPHPDVDALRLAAHHAREAVRLNVHYAEAWATLGLVLERTGDRTTAIAALRRAVELEPTEWAHHLRLAWAGSGRERQRAAARVLELMPGHPAAHWLLSTVHVARNALREAERELDAGLATLARARGTTDAFPVLALDWLKGLLLLARGATDDALASLTRELSAAGDHIYRRETDANTWYAIGACELGRGHDDAARQGFEQAIARIPTHAMAHAGLALLSPAPRPGAEAGDAGALDGALARAARLVAGGDHAGAAALVGAALAATPPGHAGWTIPIDPLLGVQRNRDAWTDVLRELQRRAQ